MISKALAFLPSAIITLIKQQIARAPHTGVPSLTHPNLKAWKQFDAATRRAWRAHPLLGDKGPKLPPILNSNPGIQGVAEVPRLRILNDWGYTIEDHAAAATPKLHPRYILDLGPLVRATCKELELNILARPDYWMSETFAARLEFLFTPGHRIDQQPHMNLPLPLLFYYYQGYPENFDPEILKALSCKMADLGNKTGAAILQKAFVEEAQARGSCISARQFKLVKNPEASKLFTELKARYFTHQHRVAIELALIHGALTALPKNRSLDDWPHAFSNHFIIKRRTFNALREAYGIPFVTGVDTLENAIRLADPELQLRDEVVAHALDRQLEPETKIATIRKLLAERLEVPPLPTSLLEAYIKPYTVSHLKFGSYAALISGSRFFKPIVISILSMYSNRRAAPEIQRAASRILSDPQHPLSDEEKLWLNQLAAGGRLSASTIHDLRAALGVPAHQQAPDSYSEILEHDSTFRRAVHEILAEQTDDVLAATAIQAVARNLAEEDRLQSMPRLVTLIADQGLSVPKIRNLRQDLGLAIGTAPSVADPQTSLKYPHVIGRHPALRISVEIAMLQKNPETAIRKAIVAFLKRAGHSIPERDASRLQGLIGKPVSTTTIRQLRESLSSS